MTMAIVGSVLFGFYWAMIVSCQLADTYWGGKVIDYGVPERVPLVLFAPKFSPDAFEALLRFYIRPGAQLDSC